jgi:hypothetical protein
MLQKILVCFQRLQIFVGGSTQHEGHARSADRSTSLPVAGGWYTFLIILREVGRQKSFASRMRT